MTGKTLTGPEITQDILKRLARLEAILICQRCEGSGTSQHRILGPVHCSNCDGTGNHLGELEHRFENSR